MLQPISEIFIPGRGHTTAASYALVSSLYGIGGKVTIGAQLSALGMNVPLTLGHPSWPAPGSEDTELGVLMELEVVMERRKFTREFKLEAVRLI